MVVLEGRAGAPKGSEAGLEKMQDLRGQAVSLSEGKKESRVSSSGYCRRRAFNHQKTPARVLNSSRVQELLHPNSRRGQALKRPQSVKVKVKDISNSRFCAKLTELQHINIIQRLLRLNGGTSRI